MSYYYISYHATPHDDADDDDFSAQAMDADTLEMNGMSSLSSSPYQYGYASPSPRQGMNITIQRQRVANVNHVYAKSKRSPIPSSSRQLLELSKRNYFASLNKHSPVAAGISDTGGDDSDDVDAVDDEEAKMMQKGDGNGDGSAKVLIDVDASHAIKDDEEGEGDSEGVEEDSVRGLFGEIIERSPTTTTAPGTDAYYYTARYILLNYTLMLSVMILDLYNTRQWQRQWK